ncbi:radical SAM protein [Pelagibacteraceae bacterium]|nr:radical SAM protein [Candidatus Pelagibacter bacterium]MDC1254163.1 radical SAM protein [Pelagibacteraceae bacterium]
MAKVLLVNPNKWGRGIAHIWIASHSSILKKNNHEVELFDCTFYRDWVSHGDDFEKEHKKTNYDSLVKFKDGIISAFQKKIDLFNPDIIFISAVSSHIHGEGEYVNIQNGYDLVKKINKDEKCHLIAGGLQATSAPKIVLENLPEINYLIKGESELVLSEIANKIDKKIPFTDSLGLAYFNKKKFINNPRQEILDNLDILSPYDYSIFEPQTFLKKYKGTVYKGIDYELSRGCIYSCAYCVETIIQKYYDFNESSKKTGAIKNFKKYSRNKSAKMAFLEISNLNKNFDISLFRCQDTNFLTIDRNVLTELSELISESNLDIKLYIETRPEGINSESIKLLKKLKVDGVGMGVEASSESFRQSNLNRFADQKKIIEAFKILKENGIKRTSYNIIGAPKQDEKSIIETIEFNRLLQPDTLSIHYYTPYHGTQSHQDGVREGMFDDYEFDADTYLRSKTKSKDLTSEKLRYYKGKFIELAKEIERSG